MLKKSFKIAKCKTSLKLATSRIKLMKNKKGVQIMQMKKELAQLLEAGDDRTARIRVEHVIREEKMVAAYDLIDIYCELIVARLPIIESQKTCPIDLKEAVTSVIFAAPRCSDIPELVDAKKQFTAKYGKEFVSAASELRPDCGVGRMLVEKLSAVAPNVQTKVKVLSDVAKEHNISWEPTSFLEKESKPPTDDLLNGPTYFEKTSKTSFDPPKVQTSNTHNVHKHEENANQHFDFAHQNKRFTVDAQNVMVADTGDFHKSFAYEDMRTSVSHTGTMNTNQSFHRNYSNSSSGKEKWNMEFKDATSAAQAAAESAEMASFAARAAAQLSSQGKITRQYSTDSQPKPKASSEYTGHHSYKASYNNNCINNSSFNDRKPNIHTTEMDIKKLSSLRSRNDSVKENPFNHLETNESSSNKCSFKSENSGQTSVVDQGKHLKQTTKYDGTRSDDESDSDDGPTYDTNFEYDDVDAKSFFPSPDREPLFPMEKPRIVVPSPKNKSGFSTGRVDSADHLSKFDLSDGPESETETVLTKSSSSGSKKSTSRFDLGYVESPTKANSTKSRIELNDLIGTGSSFYNESDELDTGKDLNFGTLTGGLKNKGGLKFPPYMKPAVKVEKPLKDDPKSKPSSFSSRAKKPDNKKQIDSKSSSESDSDDHNETFAVQKSFKTRSQFAPPDRFFNNDESDYEEEVSPVSKRTSSSKVHVGPGLSRRTKGQVEPMGKTVISNPITNHVSLQTSSTKPNKSPPEPRPDPTRFRQELTRTKPVPKITEPSPIPTKTVVESEPPKATNSSSETKHESNNNVKKPSHVHPKLPEYDSLPARIQALNKMNHR